VATAYAVQIPAGSWTSHCVLGIVLGQLVLASIFAALAPVVLVIGLPNWLIVGMLSITTLYTWEFSRATATEYRPQFEFVDMAALFAVSLFGIMLVLRLMPRVKLRMTWASGSATRNSLCDLLALTAAIGFLCIYGLLPATRFSGGQSALALVRQVPAGITATAVVSLALFIVSLLGLLAHKPQLQVAGAVLCCSLAPLLLFADLFVFDVGCCGAAMLVTAALTVFFLRRMGLTIHLAGQEGGGEQDIVADTRPRDAPDATLRLLPLGLLPCIAALIQIAAVPTGFVEAFVVESHATHHTRNAQ